jgi:predicted aconitase
MRLAQDEQAMLDGREGLARQKAMELLIKYGDALGADKFIDVDNVYILSGLFSYADIFKSVDADDVASEYFLDSSERVVVDRVKAFTTNHLFTIDLDNDHWRLVKAPKILHDLEVQTQKYCKRIGVNMTGTCTPYQTGNVPVFGEHIVWVESSAIAYANAVIGARTNIEGLESSFASALTGKTPYWGFHLDENRIGNILVEVDNVDLASVMEYEMLAYYVGGLIGLDIPIYTNLRKTPNADMLKGFSAAGASSGSIEMYHVVGVTPEAHTVEEATGRQKPKMTVSYGKEQRRETYEKLNAAKNDNVDIVAIGCPHYSMRQVAAVARLLEGKKVNGNTMLLIYTAKQIATVADRNGYTDVIKKAGGHLLIDSCPLNIYVPTTNVVATDAAKIAHYLPGEREFDNVWYGSMEDCIQAAITGRWKGELK